MKNVLKAFGIIALVAIIGFSMFACGGDDGGGDTGGNTGGNSGGNGTFIMPSTTGEFTFTDIPSKYNGKFAELGGYSPILSLKYLFGYKNITPNNSNPSQISTRTLVKIENGTVKIPLYTISADNSGNLILSSVQAYTGNDSWFIYIEIYDTEIISLDSKKIARAEFGTDNPAQGLPSTYPVQFVNGKASKSNNDADKKLQ
jgi:hypothetical protein